MNPNSITQFSVSFSFLYYIYKKYLLLQLLAQVSLALSWKANETTESKTIVRPNTVVHSVSVLFILLS